jgi:hypothetical protein
LDSFIFFIYLLCFCVVITKVPFLKKSGLNKYLLIALFVLKVIAGSAYGYFYSLPAYIQTSDTWRYFQLSKNETDLLLSNPIKFIADIFSNNYSSIGNLFIAKNSYWNNLKDLSVIKILAIVNVFTLKNYYADVIFFNFFFFFGCIAFYRLLKEKIEANDWIRLAFVFCVPSFLFWCSGVHKDGFIFLAITLFAFYFNECMKLRKLYGKALIMFIICSLLLFAMRNFVLLLLLPALLTWYICNRYPRKQLAFAAWIYIGAYMLFFMSPAISHTFDFPAYILNKQNEFRALGGNSQLPVPDFKPNPAGFVKFFPYAFDIAFLRPHPNETTNFLYWPAIAENLFIYVLILYAVYKYFIVKQKGIDDQAKAFFIFSFAFAVSNLLMMGYTITLTGAVVRYKSFVLPFLIAPLSYFIMPVTKKKSIETIK